jgi:hypothetical protein
MNQSPTIGALAAALSKAQAAYKPAVKDSANPFFKAHFLSLAGALDACRDALTSNGLALVQAVDASGDKLVLHTTLLHSSGEWIGSAYPINPVKNDPQGIGSACSYARRYSLMALVGIAAEDDDGEAAHGRTAKVDTGTGAVKTKKTVLDDEQSAIIARLNKGILDYGGDEALKKSKAVQDAVAYNSGDDIVAAVQEYHDKVIAWANKQAEKK